MFGIYHIKSLNTLIINWITSQGNKMCYDNLLVSVINNSCDGTCVRFRANRNISFERMVSRLCKRRGIQMLVLFNLFDCMGPQRSADVIKKLWQTLDADCNIYIGGPLEMACGWALEHNPQSDDNLLRIPHGDIGIRKKKWGCCFPIGKNNENNQMVLNSIIHILRYVGVEDAIEVFLPERKNVQSNNTFESEWIIKLTPDTTHEFLQNVVYERTQHMGCTHVKLVGELFNSRLFPNETGLVSCLKSLNKRNSSISISIPILNTTGTFEESLLRELHQLGVSRFCFSLFSSQLSTETVEKTRKIIEMCLTCNITPVIDSCLITPKTAWSSLRRVWALCDQVGLDVIEMLGAVHCTGQKGWCNDLCRLLTLPFFFEYRRAKAYLRVIKQYPIFRDQWHSSVLAFFDAQMNQIRNRILNEVSEFGTLRSNRKVIQQTSCEATNELTSTLDTLSEMRNDSTVGFVSPVGKAASRIHSDTAIVVVAKNNECHVHLCLHSIGLYTNHRYDLFIIDCGNLGTSYERIPCRGHIIYRRLPSQRMKSYGVAWGLKEAWLYKYVLVLDSNACALKSDWLSEMIQRLEQDPEAGASGLHYDKLDYEKKEGAAHLLRYILSPRWRRDLNLTPSITDNDLTQRLSVPETNRFHELTGWIQLYKGNVLRKIGLPVVDDRILKHHFWDSELSMRVIASGYKTIDSPTARDKLHYFGYKRNSGIHEISSYVQFVENNRRWLINNNYHNLSRFLEISKINAKAAETPCYKWY